MNLLAFALLISLLAGQQQPGPSADNSKAHQQIGKASGVTLTGNQKPPHDETGTARQQQHGAGAIAEPSFPQQLVTEWFQALNSADRISSGLLLVTAFYLGFTIMIWRQMVKSNKHAEKAHKEGAVEAEKRLSLTRESNTLTQLAVSSFGELAKAAQASADVARDALRTTQRANLLVDSIGTVQVMPMQIAYVIKNVGPTDGIIIKITTCAAVAEQLPPLVGGTPDYTSGLIDASSGGRLHPGKSMALRFPVDIAETEWRGLRTGAIRLYVFGCITYADVFGVRHNLGWSRVWTGEVFAYVSTDQGYDYAD